MAKKNCCVGGVHPQGKEVAGLFNLPVSSDPIGYRCAHGMAVMVGTACKGSTTLCLAGLYKGLVWMVVVFGVGGTVLFYYMIHRAQAALKLSSSLSSHTFMHIFGSFLGQALDHIPWVFAGRGSRKISPYDEILVAGFPRC
ncbi:hypothetical protein Pcinc_003176 [Petrolisthes cinctipes]|uniref:Uncharacterized protein n=1 Tax=Petrolisthes cinctipes TaxID=88211 RepID=A0AAE1GJG1_PETCI|nr:hypothetical protein Pcinc_003176 [Petrolisthes cinctipes]